MIDILIRIIISTFFGTGILTTIFLLAFGGYYIIVRVWTWPNY